MSNNSDFDSGSMLGAVGKLADDKMVESVQLYAISCFWLVVDSDVCSVVFVVTRGSPKRAKRNSHTAEWHPKVQKWFPRKCSKKKNEQECANSVMRALRVTLLWSL